MEQKSNLLSVIISVWQHHDLAKVHVRECMNSTLIPDEIIVVNDGGEDDLRDKLKELELKTKIIYAKILLPKVPWNYTGARNLGIWLSQGDFISLEDNDHIPERNYYQDCINTFNEHPEYLRLKTHKRWVITEEDALKNPYEKWEKIGNRPCHQDVTMNRREVFLRLKGYDERFAGEYGWCSTDLNRRINRAGITCGQAGYQYVIYSEKTRGLSTRNWKLCRERDKIQPPGGMLGFRYSYEILK